jgi:hypothetical protein
MTLHQECRWQTSEGLPSAAVRAVGPVAEAGHFGNHDMRLDCIGTVAGHPSQSSDGEAGVWRCHRDWSGSSVAEAVAAD